MKNLRKFSLLSFTEKLLFAEALFMLYLAKLFLLFFPFRMCLKTIRQVTPNQPAAKENISRVKDALRRANRLACWKNVCLVQSFAGAWMLGRRKIPFHLHFGVKNSGNTPFTAHAWLTSNGIEVVPELKEYKSLLKI